MKKRIFNIAAVSAFFVPILDLLYMALHCFGNKYASLSILNMVLYYVPFGAAELIVYNNARFLLFRENWMRHGKTKSIVALVSSGLFMVTYFIYLHRTFMNLH